MNDTNISPEVQQQIRNEATAALINHKAKLGGPARRALKSLRDRTVTVQVVEPVKIEVKALNKFSRLTLGQLLRRQKQFARRSSTALHLIGKLSEDSRFRRPLQQTQDLNLGLLRQVTAEIEFRKFRANGEVRRLRAMKVLKSIESAKQTFNLKS